MDYGSFEEFRSTLSWGSTDGRHTLVRDLTSEHLVNILNWVRDRPRQYNASLYPLLEQEANYRKLLAFAANEAIPVKCEDGRWITMLNGEATNLATDMTVNGKAPYENSTNEGLSQREFSNNSRDRADAESGSKASEARVRLR